jgi:hypothetical protein
MECPKCGASQPDGREDCSSCGVYFAKTRATLNQPRPAPPVYVDDESPWSSPWVVGSIIGLVLLIGAMWMVHKRKHRVEENPDDILNSINHKIVTQEKARAQVENDQRFAEWRMHFPLRQLPDGWNEQRVIEAIEQCSAFAPRHVDKVGQIRGADWTLVVFFTWTSDPPAQPASASATFTFTGGEWKRSDVAIESSGHVEHICGL